jgi:hypothetical protein
MKEPQLTPPHIPFWMEGAETGALARAAHAWFTMLGTVATLPARQLAPMTCSLRVLDLLAWQRNVTPYAGEPERLYRLRVNHAYANARDAGSVEGWRRIFDRLELGAVQLEERVDGQDWDIIGVVVDDAAFPDQQNVLEIIVQEYGRTCRRYRFISRITQAVRIAAATFDNNHNTVCAGRNPLTAARVAIRAGSFNHSHHTVEAIA